jgi:hypothetical protein
MACASSLRATSPTMPWTAGDAARDCRDRIAVAGDEGDASPRAAKASTSARPRPEVPPVTATRSGVRGERRCS